MNETVHNRREVMQEKIEIDLLELMGVWVKKLPIILLVSLVVGMAAFAVSKFMITPVYTSTTKLYVLTQAQQDILKNEDLNVSNSLAKDCAELATSRPVVEKVIRELNLDMSPDKFVKKIDVKEPVNERIFTISVSDPDPHMAKRAANALRRAASEEISEFMGVNAVNTVESANLPGRPSHPRPVRNGLAGFMLAFAAMLILTGIRYEMSDSIKSREEAEYYLGLNTLAEIPEEPKRYEKLYGAAAEPDGPDSEEDTVFLRISDLERNESFKTLRANIFFSGANIKTIIVTSTSGGDGKSTTSLALAASIAESGKRVILLDADMRNSTLLNKMEFQGSISGLSHYLSGQSSLNILKTNLPGLYLAHAGVNPPNPAELLQNSRFEVLLEKLESVFDYVIIDAPPVGIVADAAIIGRECDGAVFVVRTGKDSRKQAKNAISQINVAGIRLLGMVINGVDVRHSKYYDGYYGEKGKKFARRRGRKAETQ